MSKEENTPEENTPEENDENQFTLLAQILQSNLIQNHTESSTLIDSLTERAEKAEATIEAIRNLVKRVFSGDYLPHPNKVIDALYPNPEIVDYFRRQIKETNNGH